MALDKETVKNHPTLSNLLYKLGLAERRQGVPNTRKDIAIAFLIGVIVVIIVATVVITWAVRDNYKSKVIEQASYANPGCKDIQILSKETVPEGIRYTVSACGNVANYVVNKETK